MADIELVIKLSEEEYKYIREMQFCILGIRNGKGLLNRVLHAIRTGTPLPKGHGKLIDEGALKNQFPIWVDNFSSYEVNKTISKAPTIIEADKRDEG